MIQKYDFDHSLSQNNLMVEKTIESYLKSGTLTLLMCQLQRSQLVVNNTR